MKNWKYKLPNQILLNPDFSKPPGVTKIALRNPEVGEIGENCYPRETKIGSRNEEFGKTGVQEIGNLDSKYVENNKRHLPHLPKTSHNHFV